jgi:hypothetical protein
MKFFILGVILLTFVLPQADALRNDSIETIGFWDKETIDVSLVKGIYTNDDRIEQVTKAVSSQEFYNIEDNLMHKDRPGIFSPYYLGWQGALDNSNSTLKNLNFEVSRGGGDIIISLTTQSHPEGYAGETKPLFYDGKFAIVYITIYNVDKISKSQLYSIVMHEMGHAIGIGHTTAPEDVMYEKRVNVPYPYVSPCAMQALQVMDQGKTELRCNK